MIQTSPIWSLCTTSNSPAFFSETMCSHWFLKGKQQTVFFKRAEKDDSPFGASILRLSRLLIFLTTGSSSSTPFSTPRQPLPPPLSLPPFSGTQSSYRSPQTSRRQVGSSIIHQKLLESWFRRRGQEPEHCIIKFPFVARTCRVCTPSITCQMQRVDGVSPKSTQCLSEQRPPSFFFFLKDTERKPVDRFEAWVSSGWQTVGSSFRNWNACEPSLTPPALCVPSLGLVVMEMLSFFLSLSFYYWVNDTEGGSGCFPVPRGLSICFFTPSDLDSRNIQENTGYPQDFTFQSATFYSLLEEDIGHVKCCISSPPPSLH